jgi:dephospho-CoA kinase
MRRTMSDSAPRFPVSYTHSDGGRGMLIGLTGPNAAGKGAVAKYLMDQGFAYLSLSNVLREELRRRGENIERQNLLSLGNELRKSDGPGVLAERILERIIEGPSCVIDSIRHPAEVEVLRRRSDFFLVLVDAPVEVRFERTRRRGREKDPGSFEAFLELEQRELSGKDEDHQQLFKTMQMADYTVRNDGSMQELEEKIDMMLSAFESVKREGDNAE